jgi:hypothetical protein
MNVLQDFKERFLTFETVKGVYLLLRFRRYLLIPLLILVYTLGVGFAGYRWGKAGAELAHAEAQLDLSQKIRRADERIERSNSSSASNEAILKRLKQYAVHRDY